MALFVFLSKANRRAISFSERMTVHLRKKAIDLEQASKAKSEFLSSMSHELRTPLNAIIGYGGIIVEEAEEDGHKDYVSSAKRIVDSGDHLLSLITDILDISMVETGKLDIRYSKLNIHQYIEEFEETGRILAKKRGNKFIIKVENGVESISTDPTRLRQILLNLVGNAAKFTERGSIELHVSKKSSPENM